MGAISTMSLNKAGGTGGTDSVYIEFDWADVNYNINILNFYSYPDGQTITNVDVPTKSGYYFGGYVRRTSDGIYKTVIKDTGAVVKGRGGYIDPYAWNTCTADASWRIYQVVNGVGNEIYRSADGRAFSDSALTHQITTIEVPTRPGTEYVFDGARFGSTKVIDKNGCLLPAFYDIDHVSPSITLTNEWTTNYNTFGNVIDYFGLASATLVPESSDSGDGMQHVCAYNATSESATTETSGVWRNPTVTYSVVGDMTLNVTLGSAFKGEVHPGWHQKIMDISGYMITSVEVKTSIGDSPKVKITAVANEGFECDSEGYYTSKSTPAIRTYAISIPISSRHRPQNLLNAIHATNNGGELQEFELLATCDPVVLAENNMPCASDVCHGRIEVSATTGAYENEAAPQAANGFALVGKPESRGGTAYKHWHANMRKELV